MRRNVEASSTGLLKASKPIFITLKKGTLFFIGKDFNLKISIAKVRYDPVLRIPSSGSLLKITDLHANGETNYRKSGRFWNLFC
jgi:hypothetical protein